MPSPTIGHQFIELLATYCDLRERLVDARVRGQSIKLLYYERETEKAHAALVAFIDSLFLTIEE